MEVAPVRAHNDFMARLSRVAATLLPLLIGWAVLDGARAEEDKKEKGGRIFRQARDRAGVGGNAEPLLDCTFDLLTRTQPRGANAKKPIELPSRVSFIAPSVVRQEIQTPGAKIVVVFDGKQGWQVLPGDTKYLPDTASEQIRADLARTYVLFFADPEPGEVRFLREEVVDGRTTQVIELNDVGNMPLRLFVDTETFDVVKKMFVGDTPTGLAQVEEFFSDFRDVGGYRFPLSKRVMRNGAPGVETTITNMQINVGLQREALLR